MTMINTQPKGRETVDAPMLQDRGTEQAARIGATPQGAAPTDALTRTRMAAPELPPDERQELRDLLTSELHTHQLTAPPTDMGDGLSPEATDVVEKLGGVLGGALKELARLQDQRRMSEAKTAQPAPAETPTGFATLLGQREARIAQLERTILEYYPATMSVVSMNLSLYEELHFARQRIAALEARLASAPPALQHAWTRPARDPRVPTASPLAMSRTHPTAFPSPAPSLQVPLRRSLLGMFASALQNLLGRSSGRAFTAGRDRPAEKWGGR